MFYRVVLQGRALGDADLAEVKRHFIRVTGLPAQAADKLFTGTPQVIKRQVPQSDAERIVATLRAIGAAATVERELAGPEDASPEGIRIVATPLASGPPTVSPLTPAATGAEEVGPRPVHRKSALHGPLPWVAGGLLLVAGIAVLAPIVDDFAGDLRRSSAPAPVAAKRVAPVTDATPSAPPVNAAYLRGPWRCTDQQTGVSAYWSYGPDGALVFHGDTLSDRAPSVAASMPTAWKIDGARLMLTYDSPHPPLVYKIAELTLSRLKYGDEHGLDIECRRP